MPSANSPINSFQPILIAYAICDFKMQLKNVSSNKKPKIINSKRQGVFINMS
jgi:hypothetical protein